MTVEEYLDLDRNSPDIRYEYIDGIVTMMAGGTANHWYKLSGKNRFPSGFFHIFS